MLGLSISDIVSSTIYFLGTWLIPRNTPAIGFPGNVYGASGNKATCNFSGFLTQAAISGPLYNATLSMYYLLTIYYHWPDWKLKRVQHWFHILPIAWSILTSVLALILDMYGNVDWLCWILPQEDQGVENDVSSTTDSTNSSTISSTNELTEVQRHFVIFQWIFLFVPLWCCIFFVSAVMFLLWKKMKENEEKMEKYRFRISGTTTGAAGTGGSGTTDSARRMSHCSNGSGLWKDVSNVHVSVSSSRNMDNTEANNVVLVSATCTSSSTTKTTTTDSSTTDTTTTSTTTNTTTTNHNLLKFSKKEGSSNYSYRDFKRSVGDGVLNDDPTSLTNGLALGETSDMMDKIAGATTTSTTMDTTDISDMGAIIIPRSNRRLSYCSVISSSSSRTSVSASVSIDKNQMVDAPKKNDLEHWKMLRKSGIVLIHKKSLKDDHGDDDGDIENTDSAPSSSFPIILHSDVDEENKNLEGNMDLMEFLSSSRNSSNLNSNVKPNEQGVEGKDSDEYKNQVLEVNGHDEDEEQGPPLDDMDLDHEHQDPSIIHIPSIQSSSSLPKISSWISFLSKRHRKKLPRRASTNSTSTVALTTNRKRLYHKASRSRQIAVQGMLYVCAFYITWLFPTIQRLLELAGHQNKTFVVQFLDSTLLPLQGFFNFIIYIRPRLGAYRKANKHIGFWKSFWNVVWEC